MFLPHTMNCRAALQAASSAAMQQGSPTITQMHLLIGVASAPGAAYESLRECGVDFDKLQQHALAFEGQDQNKTKDVVGRALRDVEQRNHNELDVGHLFMALVADRDGDCATVLHCMGVDIDKLCEAVEHRLPIPRFPLQEALARFEDDPRVIDVQNQIEDAQRQLEHCVSQGDFQSAAARRDTKAAFLRKRETLLERLWRELPP
ncbi:MAG: hypothetical protein KDA44_10545 [Planctomycetales bacterium]|nr:hypothetical protein [Planctomycetales bacterium]